MGVISDGAGCRLLTSGSGVKMRRDVWCYQCQEDNGDESDDENRQRINPEEAPEDDSDENEEMDEM